MCLKQNVVQQPHHRCMNEILLLKFYVHLYLICLGKLIQCKGIKPGCIAFCSYIYEKKICETYQMMMTASLSTIIFMKVTCKFATAVIPSFLSTDLNFQWQAGHLLEYPMKCKNSQGLAHASLSLVVTTVPGTTHRDY